MFYANSQKGLGIMNICKQKFIKALPKMREVARELGYAIAVHGSMGRDFDIIVVPWTAQAVDSSTVAHAIRNAAGSSNWRCPHAVYGAPHGREWWPFDWDESSNNNKDYVDMSIMPRIS